MLEMESKRRRRMEGRLTPFAKTASLNLPAVVGQTCAMQAKLSPLTTREAAEVIAVLIRRLFPEMLLFVRRTKLITVVDRQFQGEMASHCVVCIMVVIVLETGMTSKL